ncbi:MAG: hypothetical protein ABEJ64_00760 [Candidatus Nanohaloarchaea archaeon]
MIRIERNTVLAVSVITASILVGLAPFVIKETSIEEVKVTFNSSVDVRDTGPANMTSLGINAGKNLKFGDIEQNANYTKWINVGVNERSRVEIRSEGNISELLRYDRVRYMKGQGRIPVELFPHSTGYYEGKVVLTVWRPRNRLGELYLETWKKTDDWF